MTVNREDVEKIPELEVLAVSDAAGVAVIKTEDSRQFFMTGHLEYDSDTLAKEYFRDLDKGMNPSIPANYFRMMTRRKSRLSAGVLPVNCSTVTGLTIMYIRVRHMM